ncbi:MAG TPA: hypothetical protein VGN34_02840 [Ktedonobacteraceae bacterium]|jgi:hypothetical protein
MNSGILVAGAILLATVAILQQPFSPRYQLVNLHGANTMPARIDTVTGKIEIYYFDNKGWRSFN